LAALMVAGCDGGTVATRAATDRVLVADRSVIVAGPPGYCVDRGLSRMGDDAAVVILGSCASIAGSADAPMPSAPAILTVTVAEEVGAVVDIGVLRAFLATRDGKAALSRSGDPDSVRILETRQAGDVIYIHARHNDAGDLPGVSDTYWRALFELNGRLVTASVVGLARRPITSDAGFDTLRSLTERLLRENGRPTVPRVEA
jgi:hypothetical protein